MFLPNRVSLSIIRNTESPQAFVEFRVWIENKDSADPPDQVTIVLPAAHACKLAMAILLVRDGGQLEPKGEHDRQFNDIMRMLDLDIPPLEEP